MPPAPLPPALAMSLAAVASLLRAHGVRLHLSLFNGESVTWEQPPVQPRLPEPLTPRELRVARLVTAGMTNAEIARRLSVSHKTVEAHLTHIYRKASVRSRTELVTRMIPTVLD